MSASVKVKNNAGTEVLYNNIDKVVLPTSDGGTAVFKRWNGAEPFDHSVSIKTSVGYKISVDITAEPVQMPEVSVKEV